jgi:hypothetical protein
VAWDEKLVFASAAEAGDTLGIPTEIAEELIIRQPPKAQAIIRLPLANGAELEARLNRLPQNSSRQPNSSTWTPSHRFALGKATLALNRSGNSKGAEQRANSSWKTAVLQSGGSNSGHLSVMTWGRGDRTRTQF